jgi:hypothetical protein
MDEGRKRVLGIMAAILASLHMQTADDAFGGPMGSSSVASPRTTPLWRSDADRGTSITRRSRNQYRWGSTERGRRKNAPTIGEMSSRIARRDFAKRFERGRLGLTGNVLQVISVYGRQQKFSKLLKRLTVGA